MIGQFPIASELEKLKPIPLEPLPDSPLVSILMPNYNYGRYIGEAIESVLRQTYPHWELIICDDGSTDNSCEVVKRYQDKDSRIKLIQKENGGVASALNVAYRESTGDIICLLDSDDVFLPAKLETIVEAFKAPSRPGYVTHRMRFVYGDGKAGEVIPALVLPETGYLGPKIYKRGGRWRYMPASAICLRREIAKFIFPIDEKLFRSMADGYIATIAPILTTVEFVDEVLNLYRLHENNLTGLGEFSADGIHKSIRSQEKILGGVNNRLKELGLPLVDIHRALHYLELKTFLSLVDPEIPLLNRLRELVRLSEATIKDDIYIPLQKIGLILGYSSVLFLPKRIRLRYLKVFKQPSNLANLVKYIFNLIKQNKTNN